MTTNVVTRMASATTLAMALSWPVAGLAQTHITPYASIGGSNVEVNGLGIFDFVDPYIKPIVQYTAGIQYAKGISPHISVVTGAQYASRGFAAREDFNVEVFGLDLPIGASFETRLDYLEIPLMLQYNVNPAGINPYIKGGASTAYALDGRITPKINAILSWSLPSIDINLHNDMYNRWDVSAVAGAGVDIPTNENGSIKLEVNYRHSLNDMFLDNITDIRIKSHGISAGIGYTLRF